MSGEKENLSADVITGQQYEVSSLAVDARAELYKYSYPEINIWDKFTDELELNGDEVIVDVGAGHGRWAIDLARNRGHQGDIYAINNTDIAHRRLSIHDGDIPENIHFVLSDARDLYWDKEGMRSQIPDESVDVVSAQFLLYHVSNPDAAIDEMFRVLKPGGKLLLATRSSLNHARMWRYADAIAKELRDMTNRGETVAYDRATKADKVYDYSSIIAPASWYSHFDIQDAVSSVEGKADIEKFFAQETPEYELRIGGEFGHHPEEAYVDYRNALDSLRYSFYDVDAAHREGIRENVPTGGHWNSAVDKVVKPQFEAEIAERGYFLETVSQGYVIAIKK